MYSKQRYIGCPCKVENLVEFIDHMNSKVVEQINNSQELVMLNKFVLETNERHFIQSVKDRISDITSWNWVLQDLSKRLEDAVPTLEYEHNAVKVVIERVDDELNEKAMEGRKLGALGPVTDTVEDVLIEEYKFLKTRKKKFQNILPEIEKHINLLKDTKKKIEDDILNKELTISIEEACANINPDALAAVKEPDNCNKKKRLTTMSKWICRCQSLKEGGLTALRRSVILRQIIRGARVELSFAAQCYGAKVDAALRKRLHYNVSQLEEITWQKDEALKDLISLDEELVIAQKSLQNTTEQKQVVLQRIRDRARRPYGEKTIDVVDKNLREELNCVKNFSTHLRKNIDRIKLLQHQLKEAIAHMDKCSEGVSKVMELDQKRIKARLGESEPVATNRNQQQMIVENDTFSGRTLTAIEEVDEEEFDKDEEDDYPFDF